MLEQCNSRLKPLYQKVSAGRYRPRWHLASPCGWMNDPHTPVWFKGAYHLFYNQFPFDAQGVRPKIWGHAVTRDFCSYTIYPFAIAPDCSYDRDGCASGSVIAANDQLVLAYTGRNYFSSERECQCIASSSDGIHFQKQENNPVIRLSGDAGENFRDPWIYRSAGEYRMIVAQQQGPSPVLRLYRSRNLITWEDAGIFCDPGSGFGTMWECPSLGKVNGQDFLVVSPEGMDDSDQKTVVFSGMLSGDGCRFEPVVCCDLDYGCDYYAGQFFTDRQGNPCLTGWIGKWENQQPARQEGWIGACSLPRLCLPPEDGAFRFAPHPILEGLRGRPSVFSRTVASQDKNPFETVRGDCMEIRLTIGRETLEPGFTMRLFDGDKPDGLQLEFSKGAIHVKNLTVCHPGSVHTAPVPDGNDPLSIAIFLDVSIAEIFIDNRIAISHRVYPRNGSNRITVFAPQPFSVERAVFYPLRNAPISFWD